MSLQLVIRLALKNIVNNRLRSGLTILGLVIGIASVIILVGIGNGTTSSVMNQVSSLGADIITVRIDDSDQALAYEDISGIREVSGVADVSPYQVLSATLSRGGDTSSRASLVGAGEGYLSMMGYTLKEGRSMSRVDVENCTKVAILGSDVAEEFWGIDSPVGDVIRVDGDQYTVIGVLESVGSSMGNNVDEAMLIPITTAKYLGVDTSITNLYVRASDKDSADRTCTALERYFTEEKGVLSDDLSVTTQESMLETMESINNTLSMLLGGIAGISLLVGGIGVMNVMLVSVMERTREIGIRKSLGARRKDILIQFLMEAMVLSVLGGLIGIVIGLAGGMVVSLFGMTFAPGTGIIVLAACISMAVGLVFGIFPSYRAACLRPVEALRYE